MEEPNVFYGVGKDEMVIGIEEYENMKKEIKYLKEKEDQQFHLRQTIRDENLELRAKISKKEKELEDLKGKIAMSERIRHDLYNEVSEIKLKIENFRWTIDNYDTVIDLSTEINEIRKSINE